VTSEVAEALGLDKARGALIVKVTEGGPAANAGLKAGEIVTAVDGISVEHPDALLYRLTTAGLGKSVNLTVIENGSPQQVALALGRAPETSPRDQRTIGGRTPFTGTVVENLSPRVADELRMPPESTGVVVADVKDDSPAARLGFEPKDIIVSINGTEVKTTEELAQIADSDPSLWRVEIERDGQRIRQFFR
jgi:S1-C subfamily serine protease